VHRGTALISLAFAVFVAGVAPSARANEWTDIASAFDENNPINVFVGVDYTFEARRAAIKRELSGAKDIPAAPDQIPVGKDLFFSQDRHILKPYLDVGLFHDVQLSVALPITLSLSRTYEFDQRAEPCVFPSAGGAATCIDRTNSSTLTDGLLPNPPSGPIGFDANDPTTNFDTKSKTIFRSPSRSGLDQLWIALSWAPMNQARDDTKPTWILTAEFRPSIGKLMKLDTKTPSKETGVSTGIHEFRAQTSVSKHVGWATPFVVFWWQAPLGERGNKPGDPDGSLFWNTTTANAIGQRTKDPQQHAGTIFGFDATLVEKPEDHLRLALELLGKVEAHFTGLGYSEMWEIFAYAGDITRDPNAPLRIDLDPLNPGANVVSHPGVTTIENYVSFAGRIGVVGELGPHAKFSLSFELGKDQQHIVSFTDAGVDLPTCDATHTAPDCETMANVIVNQNTREVNPLHKQLIDTAGRRFIVDETTTYSLLATGEILF
jgi:hypothetical protein